MNNYVKALHDLICSTLRGGHVRTMTLSELQDFNYKLAVALHNVPDKLRKLGELPLANLREINELDPTGSGSSWGEWCKQFSITIEQELPLSPSNI